MAAPRPLQAVLHVVPLMVLAVVLLDSATDFFPDDPLTGVVTPARLALGLGLVALVAGGARLSSFRTRLDLPVVVLLGAATATTFLGGHPTAPLRGLLTVVAGFYFVVGLRRTQPESWRAFGLLATVCVAAAGTAAFTQVTNDVPTGFCRTGLLTDVGCGAGGDAALTRAVGTFSNPNLLSAFLVLLTPFLLLAFVAVGERTAATAVTLVAVVAYGAVLTTYSRAGYVAAVAGLLVLGGAYWVAPRLDRRQRRIATAGGLLLLLGGGAAIWQTSRAGDSLGVRGGVWEAALRIAAHNPMGVGLDRAGAVVSAAVPGDQVFVHTHNMWLNWLVETGPVGLLGMLGITVVALLSAARAAREKSVIGTAGLAALTGFFLSAMVDHPANQDRIAALLWLVLGVVMAEVPARWRRPAPTAPHTPPAAALPAPRHGAGRPISARPAAPVPALTQRPETLG
ncbi:MULTISPECIES: O-antigen ligase family protein [unclassified Streptomyces]|uniref:O-antigen ligase family protein n=1 Tax=unclassified Streptomyces TaxID=2593676 RepID=UPI00382FEAB4